MPHGKAPKHIPPWPGKVRGCGMCHRPPHPPPLAKMHSRGIFNNRHKPLQTGGLLDVNAWLFFGEQSPMVDEIQFPKYSQSIYLDRPVPLANCPTCRSPPSHHSICDGIVIARISAFIHAPPPLPRPLGTLDRAVLHLLHQPAAILALVFPARPRETTCHTCAAHDATPRILIVPIC